MTDRDWCERANLASMIRWVLAHAPPRKRTLVHCAQCRRLGSLIGPELDAAVEALERFADGQATEAEVVAWVPRVEGVAVQARHWWHQTDRDVAAVARRWDAACTSGATDTPTAPLFVGAEYLRARAARLEAATASAAVQAVYLAVVAAQGVLTDLSVICSETAQRQAETSAIAELAVNWDRRADGLAERLARHPQLKGQIAAKALEWSLQGLNLLDGVSERQIAEARGRADRASVRTLHDLFGNPFRPVPFDPRWRTADVVGVARAIYDDRAFDRLPLLADALLDAGCDSDEVIGHCREPGAHYRGCWVVDAVLGKDAPDKS